MTTSSFVPYLWLNHHIPSLPSRWAPGSRLSASHAAADWAIVQHPAAGCQWYERHHGQSGHPRSRFRRWRLWHDRHQCTWYLPSLHSVQVFLYLLCKRFVCVTVYIFSIAEGLPFKEIYNTVGFKETEAKVYLSSPITVKILEVERFTSVQDRFNLTTQRSVNKVKSFLSL